MFFQVFIEGIIIFGINAVISSVLFLALGSYIRDRVEEWLSSYISDYIREQLEIALQNPERTAKVLSPLFNALVREIMKDFERQNKPQPLNLFGFKIPAEIAQILIQRFLGNESEKNINPFS